MTQTIYGKILPFLKLESSQDALRNILVILLPSVFLFFFYDSHFAIAFAVGILLSALTDLPGNKRDKVKTSLFCIPIFFITAISIATALHAHSWIIIPLLGLFGFIYTLIALLGFRINVVGNLGLIVASFTIGLRPEDPWAFTIAVTAGAIFFFAVSLIQVYSFPFRSLRFAVAGGVQQMANLIRLKVDCYDEQVPLAQTYKNLSALHTKVSDQLEAVRSLLLRDKKLFSENDQASKLWLAKLYQLIDLYELLMAVDNDYEQVREVLKGDETLAIVRRSLVLLSEETAQLSIWKRSSEVCFPKRQELDSLLQQLESKKHEGNFEKQELIQSICKQLRQVSAILLQLEVKEVQSDQSWLESKNFKDFVAPKVGLGTIWNNLTFKSAIFSYAVRMAILLMLGGLIGYYLPEFRYASWILLTIILVARPSYNNTQKRNYQRIIGSLIGIGLSFLILFLITDPISLLVIAIVCLYLFLLFNRPNYLVCVIFITITILLGQHMYEGKLVDILGSRVAFTLLGSIFAVLGCLAIPINHYRSIQQNTHSLVEHFRTYLQKIQEGYASQNLNYYDLRLMRKFTQASLAQSYDALEEFAKDPISGKYHKKDVVHLQTLAYRINALLVGLSVQMTKLGFQIHPKLMEDRMNYVEGLIEEAEKIAERLQSKKPLFIGGKTGKVWR